MAILVTGGAGYIGSHTVLELLARGEEAVIIDSLENGHRKSCPGGVFYHGDLRDDQLMDRVFRENDIEAVMHFAAYTAVGESVSDPFKYYDNNVVSSLRLLARAAAAGVKKVVFSSSAAVYGEPTDIPIPESHVTLPKNPYGDTKLTVEKALVWAEGAYGIKHVILRYFNAAGAHPGGDMGEDHRPETHLIPLVLRVALGRSDQIKIFGNDYDTPDGTCVRDYIHVSDLAVAHVLGLERIRRLNESGVYNLGNGAGFSNLEVVKTAEAVTGRKIGFSFSCRRPGDPAVLLASSRRIKEELGWKPRFEKLEEIIETAWRWHSRHPDGFADD
ncbi:MAG: UDP-glucose 4-epimerase GalE [Bacillota bacterium]